MRSYIPYIALITICLLLAGCWYSEPCAPETRCRTAVVKDSSPRYTSTYSPEEFRQKSFGMNSSFDTSKRFMEPFSPTPIDPCAIARN